jgi:hypothetical protein
MNYSKFALLGLTLLLHNPSCFAVGPTLPMSCSQVLKQDAITKADLTAIVQDFPVPRAEYKKLNFDEDKMTWNGPDPILKSLGEGNNATVVQSRSKRVFKIAAEAKLAARLFIEFALNNDLKKRFAEFKIRTDDILNYGPGYVYLEKVLINKKNLAENIAKNDGRLTNAQRASLEKLFLNAKRYAYETGIGLDLKASNLYWDEKTADWVLFDCGPRISYKTFGYTIDLDTFNDYLNVWRCEEPDCTSN